METPQCNITNIYTQCNVLLYNKNRKTITCHIIMPSCRWLSIAQQHQKIVCKTVSNAESVVSVCSTINRPQARHSVWMFVTRQPTVCVFRHSAASVYWDHIGQVCTRLCHAVWKIFNKTVIKTSSFRKNSTWTVINTWNYTAKQQNLLQVC